VLALALEQFPAPHVDREILVRADIGGATYAFTADCRDPNIRFSVGYELNDTIRQAILELPEAARVQAIDADGSDREGAWVAELTERVDLSVWPHGSRLICRRERLHPGAQCTIFDDVLLNAGNRPRARRSRPHFSTRVGLRQERPS
jgi:Transposase DDE domain group 1